MKKVFLILVVLFSTTLITKCDKSEDTVIVPLRDYAEQYAADKITIDTYISTHYYKVDTDFNVDFKKISTVNPTTPAGYATLSSISTTDNTVFPHFEEITINRNNVDYKVRIIKFRQGNGGVTGTKRPTQLDSVKVAYKGLTTEEPTTTTTNQFDISENPTWLNLQSVIVGWAELFPCFNSGDYGTIIGPEPTVFSNFGAGVFFIPSGLGYFASSQPNIPAYSPLIFTMKLFEVQYCDQDKDGIFSKDERPTTSTTLPDYRINPLNTDTDGDGTPDCYDIDDDGDSFLTKYETRKLSTDIGPFNASSTSRTGLKLYYPYNPIPSKEPLGIPDCTGNNTNPDRLRRHLDRTCH